MNSFGYLSIRRGGSLLVCLLSCFLAQTSPLAQSEKKLLAQHDTTSANALNKLSWEYRRTDAQKAIRFGERARQISRELNYGKGLAYSYKNLGAIYSIDGNFKKANFYFSEALQQFSELHNRSEVGNIYNLYGLLYWETGKYESALINYDMAIRYYKQVKDLEGISMVYSNSGIIYYETGKLHKALSRYAKALDIAEKRNDLPLLASVHANIGLVYNLLGDYPKALYHQKTSLRFETKQENIFGIARSYTNIGVMYYQMNNPDSSLIYHQKALKIYEEINEKKGISQSLLNIGSIYNDRADYPKANNHYLLALAIKREISDALGETSALTHLGTLRMNQNQITEAIAYLDTAFRQAYSIKSLKYQVETSKLLAQLHEQLGHSSKSMLYYKIYTEANERFLREQSNNKLTNTLVGLATKGKQRQISTLEKKVTTVSNRAILTIIIIVVLISILIVLLIRRHKKEQLRLNTELAAHTQALMDFTRQMMEKNAEVQALQEQLEVGADLDTLRTRSDTETLPSDSSSDTLNTRSESTLLSPERVETLNRLSKARIVTDEDWKTFKELYTHVHPRFMLRMKELYSGITQAELRLAALITLQLSSKEIAAILGISVESVKKSRQRLRKKMELTAEQELDYTLIQLSMK